jgi:hypothetical protein
MESRKDGTQVIFEDFPVMVKDQSLVSRLPISPQQDK